MTMRIVIKNVTIMLYKVEGADIHSFFINKS